MAFLIPSIQFFFFFPRAIFCFGIHFYATLGNLSSTILWTWPYHVSWFCSISFTKIAEKIKTHILCSANFFAQKWCYIWDNVGRYGRADQATDDNVIWSMAMECRITNAAETHSKYVIFLAFAQQQWLCQRVSVSR
jgi:hypothetical protein